MLMSVMITGCSSSQKREMSKQEKIARELYQESWLETMNSHPVWASQRGFHKNDHRLGSNTLAEVEREHKKSLEFLNRAKKIDRSELSRSEQINLDLFVSNLENGVNEHKFKGYFLQLSPTSGFHTEFAQLGDQTVFESIKDYENYISRLNDFSRLTDETLSILKRAADEGYAPPKVVYKGYDKTINALIFKDVTKSSLYSPFKKMAKKISSEDQVRLRALAVTALKNSVMPSFKKFKEFWNNDLYPRLSSEISISKIPQGADYYKHRIRYFTTTSLSAEQIHDIGRSEVSRIRTEMLGILKRVNFKGGLKKFFVHLRKSKKFYPKTEHQLLAEVSYHLKRMDGALPKLFKNLPRAPYGIKKIPDYMAPKQTTAYYQQPDQDGKRAGFYFVNTYDLKSRPLYEVEALSYHEAVPGHHLQLAIQQEVESVPDFRKQMGITAFIEGWALYSESLGKDIGFYEDPYSDFGRLTYEMWRACRLVVDTGLHAFDWSREKAVAYLEENTALTKLNIRSEVDRYISWPGQALAYKIGQMKILELRNLAEKALGKKYDIREFHDIVLRNGAIPLGLLEKEVHRYLVQKKKEPM